MILGLDGIMFIYLVYEGCRVVILNKILWNFLLNVFVIKRKLLLIVFKGRINI